MNFVYISSSFSPTVREVTVESPVFPDFSGSVSFASTLALVKSSCCIISLDVKLVVAPTSSLSSDTTADSWAAVIEPVSASEVTTEHQLSWEMVSVTLFGSVTFVFVNVSTWPDSVGATTDSIALVSHSLDSTVFSERLLWSRTELLNGGFEAASFASTNSTRLIAGTLLFFAVFIFFTKNETNREVILSVEVDSVVWGAIIPNLEDSLWRKHINGKNETKIEKYKEMFWMIWSTLSDSPSFVRLYIQTYDY